MIGKVTATTKLNNEGVAEYQILGQEALPKDFRRIAKFLLHTEVRKHNRYCPCCKNYQEGNDLSPV
jgi:hypothetical protein